MPSHRKALKMEQKLGRDSEILRSLEVFTTCNVLLGASL